MSDDYLKITFHLDGAGVYYDPLEPPHLDSLAAWVLAPFHAQKREITRDDTPDEIPTPFAKRSIGNVWLYAASALFPVGEQQTITYWRKRFRVHRIELTKGSPNLKNGTWRNWHMPLPLLLTPSLTGYAVGQRREVLKVLRRVKAIGKKRAYGFGRVVDVEISRVDHDWSWIKDGRAMRWLPDQQGTRLVRLRPPYWHPHDRVACCEVGDPWGQEGQQ